MSDDLVRLARTEDGRIVRETDRDAAFYVGVGTAADLSDPPKREPEPEPVSDPDPEPEPAPAPKAAPKRKPGRPKGSTTRKAVTDG